MNVIYYFVINIQYKIIINETLLNYYNYIHNSRLNTYFTLNI